MLIQMIRQANEDELCDFKHTHRLLWYKKVHAFNEKSNSSVFGSVSCVSVLSILKEKRYPV